MERVADRSDGPDAGVHRMTALEFLARGVDHVPERDEVRVRDAGAYATRRRVGWRRRGVRWARTRGEPPSRVEHEASGPALRARRRRWAAWLRLVFKVDVEGCARCGGEARIIGFVTEPQVVRRILAPLDRRGVDARAGPWGEVGGGPGLTGLGGGEGGRREPSSGCGRGCARGGERTRRGCGEAGSGRGEGAAAGGRKRSAGGVPGWAAQARACDLERVAGTGVDAPPTLMKVLIPYRTGSRLENRTSSRRERPIHRAPAVVAHRKKTRVCLPRQHDPAPGGS